MSPSKSLRPGETKRCEACGQELIGARTKSGKVAPITYEPRPDGTVLLFRKGGVVECRTFAGSTLDVLRLNAVPLRTNHFADCPDALRFTRSREVV